MEQYTFNTTHTLEVIVIVSSKLESCLSTRYFPPEIHFLFSAFKKLVKTVKDKFPQPNSQKASFYGMIELTVWYSFLTYVFQLLVFCNTLTRRISFVTHQAKVFLFASQIFIIPNDIIFHYTKVKDSNNTTHQI